MKKLQLSIIILLISVTLFSCEDANVKDAKNYVDNYADFVDSISIVSTKKLRDNWYKIESTYLEKKLQAQSSVETIGEFPELNEKLDKANSKFEELNIKHQIEAQKSEDLMIKLDFRKSLFEGKEVEEDLNFQWVDKNNIADTYETFVNSVYKNITSFSSDEWKEINRIYNALETKKNILEFEGITTEDNLKIKGLKLKFEQLGKSNSFDFNSRSVKPLKK